MKKIIVCALALAVVLWLYSCRVNEQIQCSECQGARPIPGYLYLNLGQHAVSTDYEYWDAGKYQLALKQLPSDQYREIFTWLQNSCPHDGLHYSIILYFKRGLNGNDSLTEKDVSGISFYLVREQKMFHLLYQNTAGIFVKNEDLSCEVKGVYSNHISYMLQNIMPGEHKSWLMLYGPMETEPLLSRPKDKLSLRLKKFSEKHKEQPPDEPG